MGKKVHDYVEMGQGKNILDFIRQMSMAFMLHTDSLPSAWRQGCLYSQSSNSHTVIMEDMTLHNRGHAVTDCCKGQAWQPPWCHQHRGCTHKLLREAEGMPKWIDFFKSMLNHCFKETPDFTHLMAQHVETQHFRLTSWIKQYFFQFVLPPSTTVGLGGFLMDFSPS